MAPDFPNIQKTDSRLSIGHKRCVLHLDVAVAALVEDRLVGSCCRTEDNHRTRPASCLGSCPASLARHPDSRQEL